MIERLRDQAVRGDDPRHALVELLHGLLVFPGIQMRWSAIALSTASSSPSRGVVRIQAIEKTSF